MEELMRRGMFFSMLIGLSLACSADSIIYRRPLSHNLIFKPVFDDLFPYYTYDEILGSIDGPVDAKYLPSNPSRAFGTSSADLYMYGLGLKINTNWENWAELVGYAGYLSQKRLSIHLEERYADADTQVDKFVDIFSESDEAILGARFNFWGKEYGRMRIMIGVNSWSSIIVRQRGYIKAIRWDKYNWVVTGRKLDHKLKLKPAASINVSLPFAMSLRIWRGLSLTGELETGFGMMRFKDGPQKLKRINSAGFGLRYELNQRTETDYTQLHLPKFFFRVSSSLVHTFDKQMQPRDYNNILSVKDTIKYPIYDSKGSGYLYPGRMLGFSAGYYLPVKNFPRLISLELGAGYMFRKKFYTRGSYQVAEYPNDTFIRYQFHSRRDYISLSTGFLLNIPADGPVKLFAGARIVYMRSVFASSVLNYYVAKTSGGPYEGGFRSEGKEKYNKPSLEMGNNALPSVQFNYIFPVGLSWKPGEYISISGALLFGGGFEKIRYQKGQQRDLIGAELFLTYEL